MTIPSQILRVRTKHLPWIVIGLIILVMAATVTIITPNLRRGLRNHIIQQDGLMLYAASVVPTTVAEDLPAGWAKDKEFVLVAMTDKVTKASQQKGVLALRVFADEGKSGFGAEGTLTDDELARL